MATIIRLSDRRRSRQRAVFFTRPELNQLLSLYSRQVARGEWRDYAISQHDGAALFAVFRHTQESPVYTVVKAAALGEKAGGFTLLHGRQRLAQGKNLPEILSALPRALRGAVLRFEGEGVR